MSAFGGKADTGRANAKCLLNCFTMGLICKFSVPLSELAPSIVPPASDTPAVLAADMRPKTT